MEDTFILGEIRLFAAMNMIPKGFAVCDGRFLLINQNTALYSLLGTSYGGNGVSHFALPDLRNSVPIGASNPHEVGKKGGDVAVNALLPGNSEPPVKTLPTLTLTYMIAVNGCYPERSETL
jgi:microcystin-dependent protein